MQAFQNINMTITPLIYGTIRDATYENKGGYVYGLFFFQCVFLISFFLTLILVHYDAKHKRFFKKKEQ